MDQFAQHIRDRKRFLVTTHFLPDGDGLGAQMALHFYLQRVGKQSFAINGSPTPTKFQLVDPRGEIRIFRPGESLPVVDAILVVDTNDSKMLGPMEQPLRRLGKPILFIDHHVPDTLDRAAAGAHLIDESYSSTGELVYTLLEHLHAPLDREIAMAVYVALVTDTDSFRFKRTTSRSHRIAAALLDHGVEPEDVYRTIYAHDSLGKVRLLGHVLEGAATTPDEQIVWLTVTKKMRDHYGATVEDTESFANQLTLMDGVKIGLLFREEDDGRVKVSLRGNGDTPVFELAKKFGGGGHRHAAGLRLNESLKRATEMMVREAQLLLGGF